MTSIIDIFQQTQLAEAAYANFMRAGLLLTRTIGVRVI